MFLKWRPLSQDDSATVLFEGEKVGTILSSVDDYLMNATIVEKLFYSPFRGSLVGSSV